MKKLVLVLISISLNSYGDVGLLQAPFAEATYKRRQTTAGRLVVPPMVSEAVYREALAADCLQFQEMIFKYRSQLSAEELISLVTAPLPYSMKKSFEVEVVFPLEVTKDLKEAGELHFQSQAKEPVLKWSEPDLLRDVLKLSESLHLTELPGGIRLRFTRRDMFCSYSVEKLNLSIERLVYWKLSEKQMRATKTNLILLFQALKPVLTAEKGKMLMAALAGRAMHLVSKQSEFQAEKKFTSIDYIWNLIFENEDSMKKSSLWNLPDSGTFLQNDTHVLLLQGLQ